MNTPRPNPYDADDTGTTDGAFGFAPGGPALSFPSREPNRAQRDKVLAELWELAAAGVNTTRLVDLVIMSWHNADHDFDVVDQIRTDQAKRLAETEGIIDGAELAADLAKNNAEAERELRVSLNDLVESWRTAAGRVQKIQGRGMQARLVRAIRAGAKIS
jgi:hypothetical protein